MVSIPLPERPLSLRSRVKRPRLVSFDTIALAFIAAIMVLAPLYIVLPGLIVDTRIGSDYTVARDVGAEGDCMSKLFLTICSVNLDDGERTRTEHVAYLGPPVRQVETGRSRNGNLVAQFAQERLLGRWLMLFAVVGGFLALIYFATRETMRTWRVYRESLKMQDTRLTAQHVRVTKWENERAEYGRLSERRLYSVQMAPGFDPLFTGQVSDGSALAMAVSRGGGGAPVLVDAKLSNLDLSDEEREAVFRDMMSNFQPA